MKSLLKILLGLFECIIVVFAICMISILFFKNRFGYTELFGNTLIIVDDLNAPELKHFKSGDLVLIKETLYNDLNEGDEVYYYDSLNDVYIVRSGILKSKSGDNRAAIYYFEGEENASVSNQKVLGVHNKTYNNLGKLLKFLTSTAGFLIFVILPILVLFIYQVYHLVMVLKYEDN